MIFDMSTKELEAEKIKAVINQASKSWIVPSGEFATVISDIGEPNEEKYPAWEHAGDIGFWYLDVTNGKLYQPKIIIIPNGGEYSDWAYVRTCESVQSELEAMQTVESRAVTLESMLSSHFDTVIRKVNHVVELSLAVSITADVTSWSKIASIPSEFAPPLNRYFQASTGERAGIQVIITSAGTIMLGASLTSGSSLYFDVSYIV